MADNSTREQLILRVIEELTSIPWVNQTRRVRPTMEDLTSYSSTMLPLIIVEAGLPVPVEKKSSRVPGRIDLFVSELSVEVFCYILENEEPDVIISNYLDDIWVKLHEDPLKNSLCIGTTVKPRVEKLILSPYTAFSVNVVLTYIHTILHI